MRNIEIQDRCSVREADDVYIEVQSLKTPYHDHNEWLPGDALRQLRAVDDLAGRFVSSALSSKPEEMLDSTRTAKAEEIPMAGKPNWACMSGPSGPK